MNQAYRVCDAMNRAGISNPESRAGIDFCTSCPYPKDCILFIDDRVRRTAKARAKSAQALKLLKSGHTVRDIADIMGKSKRQIERYLGGHR